MQHLDQLEQAIWVPDYERKSNYGWLALNNDKLFTFVCYQAHCNTDMKIVLLYPLPQKKKKKKNWAMNMIISCLIETSILKILLTVNMMWVK